MTWQEGNVMPSPDEPKATNGKPVERQLNIYNVVTLKDIQGQAPLFTQVQGKLIKSVKANAKDMYECELPSGLYSLFSLESNGTFFANSFSGGGQINPVLVEQGKITRLDVQLNYKVAY